MIARRLDTLGIRTAAMTPHALRHPHATTLWEDGLRELSCSSGWAMPHPNQRASTPGCLTPR